MGLPLAMAAGIDGRGDDSGVAVTTAAEDLATGPVVGGATAVDLAADGRGPAHPASIPIRTITARAFTEPSFERTADEEARLMMQPVHPPPRAGSHAFIVPSTSNANRAGRARRPLRPDPVSDQRELTW
jgi:hypothetical protein